MKLKPYQCQLFQNFNPCFLCGKDCNKNEHSFFCNICCKWFCRKCLKLTIIQSIELEKSNGLFICGKKCEISLLPFINVDSIDFLSALTGEVHFPCKHCNRECMDGLECVQCDVCDSWCHTACIYDDIDAHSVIVDNNYDVIW